MTNETPAAQQRRTLDLSGVLAPQSIAVIGASENVRLINGQAINYMRQRGYQGKVYPVHPRHKEVQGLPCYPDLKSLPGPVDTAFLFDEFVEMLGK